MTRRSDIDAALAEIYAEIPGCKGQCWFSCTAIDMSARERQVIRERGIRITPRLEALRQRDAYWCEALSRTGQCLVYDRRPAVCRVWGTARSVACPLGCQPERWLTEREMHEVLARAMHVGGSPFSRGGVDELLTHYDGLQRAGIFDFLAREGQQGDRARAMNFAELPPEVTRRRK